MKKLMSIVLALCMALSLCMTTTWADEPTVTADTTWYGDGSASEYTISDAADLLAFAAAANDSGATFAGKKVTLAADINLGNIVWPQVKRFGGEFDGGNHTISYFKIVESACGTGDAAENASGFFRGLVDTAYIHDLTLDNVTATANKTSYWGFGTLAGRIVRPDLKNVTVSNVTITATDKNVSLGGLCSRAEEGWNPTTNCFTGCKVKNLTLNAPNGISMVGGLIRVCNASNIWYKDCSVERFKATIGTGSKEGLFGGFTMQTQTMHSYASFTNCHVTGLDVTAAGDVYLGGFMLRAGAQTTVKRCSVSGKIDASGVTGKGNFVGGFFGDHGWGGENRSLTHKVTDSTANVDITSGGAVAGGFIAVTNQGLNGNANKQNSTSFENCTATGNVTNTADGGIAGGFGGVIDKGTFTNCTANGSMFGKISVTNATDNKLFAIVLDCTAATMAPNDTLTLNATIYPNAGYAVQWESSDDTVATVDENGVVTAVSDGSATITAKLVDASAPTEAPGEDANVATQALTNGEPTPEQTVYATATCAVTVETPETPTHSHTRRQPTTTTEVAPDTTKTDVVTSAKTFDAGIAVYAVMGILSLTGSAWVVGKKRG